MNTLGLRILAESPAYIARRITAIRRDRPNTSAHAVAVAVVESLNEGQRWARAVASVEVDVLAHDRGKVREIERASIRRQPREVIATFDLGEIPRRPSRARDPLLIERAIADTAPLRSLAERMSTAMDIVLTSALLDSDVKLGDGRIVATGDATVEDRQTRIAMLEPRAQGQLETLAFELALLRMQVANGNATIRELAR